MESEWEWQRHRQRAIVVVDFASLFCTRIDKTIFEFLDTARWEWEGGDREGERQEDSKRRQEVKKSAGNFLDTLPMWQFGFLPKIFGEPCIALSPLPHSRQLCSLRLYLSLCLLLGFYLSLSWLSLTCKSSYVTWQRAGIVVALVVATAKRVTFMLTHLCTLRASEMQIMALADITQAHT